MKQIITESIIKKECHDCKKDVDLNKDYLLTYDEGGSETDIFKCADCFKKNKSLENYRSCEVYSRICGYIRPVQSSNAGKRQEISDRKTFKI